MIDIYKSKCLNFVDKYSDKIYDELVNGLQPDDICSMIICKDNDLNLEKSEKKYSNEMNWM